MVDLRLSWSLSDSTPPHTMAPRRPFPIGAASVKYVAGDANTTFRGRASSSAGHPAAAAAASASTGRRTQTHSAPASEPQSLSQSMGEKRGVQLQATCEAVTVTEKI